MNCPNCGTSNLDNASLCINCGRPLTAAAPPPPPPPQASQTYTPPPPVNTYAPPPPIGGIPGGAPGMKPPGGGATIFFLIASIFMTLCCCNPFALVPLVLSIMTMGRRGANDYAGTARLQRLTMIWFWVAVVSLFVWVWLSWTFFGARDFLDEIRRNMPR